MWSRSVTFEYFYLFFSFLWLPHGLGVALAQSLAGLTLEPALLQAEAKAIHWTVQIAGTTGMNSIGLESDLKQCIDALSSSQESIPWCIRRCVVKILSCFDF